MDKQKLFYAVVGSACSMGAFTVYNDLSFSWRYKKDFMSGSIPAATLQSCLSIAQQKAGKFISQAHIQEWEWNPRSLGMR